MPKTLTGAARNASDRAALIRRATHAIASADPSHVEALLVEAFALSTPAQRAALEREHAARVEAELQAMVDGSCYRCPADPAGRIDPLEPDAGLCRGCLDEVSHANEERRYATAGWLLAEGDGS